MPPFHLAFPVSCLDNARHFYGTVLQCTEGRSAERWVDFDFFGHQISAHLQEPRPNQDATNEVDGDAVPIRHFGVILDIPAWRNLTERLAQFEVTFLIPPKLRFEGQAGEQGTCFVTDPCGNVLEFKCFASPEQIFQTETS